MNQDIRWQQRLDQLSKACSLMDEGLQIKAPSRIETAGIIQAFEMSFELSWKLLKDYLNQEGFDVASPRGAIKQAFQVGLLEDGHAWIKILEDRNITTHTYNEQTAEAVLNQIRNEYSDLVRKLLAKMSSLQWQAF